MDDSGQLRGFGYRALHSDGSRRYALQKALKDWGRGEVERALKQLADVQPRLRGRIRADLAWVAEQRE